MGKDFLRTRLYNSDGEGGTINQWKRVVSKLKSLGANRSEQLLFNGDSETNEKEWKEEKDKAEFKGVTNTSINTLEDALKFCDADLEKWEPIRWVFNSWDVSNKDGNKFTNYQVKIWFQLRVNTVTDFKNNILQEIQSKEVPLKHIVKGKEYSITPMIADHHLGREAFDTQNMKFIWSMEDAIGEYNNAITYTLDNIDTKNVAEFIFPIGNDLLQVDNSNNSTTKGTPVQSGEFWHNLLQYSYHTTKNNIKRLSKYAPVKCYMIPGNHDFDSVFSLGMALSAYFENDKNVQIINNGILRHYHSFGLNLSGFTHGNEKNPIRLHAAMSTDCPGDFGQSKYRSFYIGHLHKNSKRSIIDLELKEEYNGVEIEVCPSLTPTDRWHYKNLFIGNLRRSKIFVNHITDGKVKELYYNL